MRQFSVALLPDFQEENWPSMDLVSEMLYREISSGYSSECRISTLRPHLKRRLSLPRLVFGRSFAWNADRLINRFFDYPSWLRQYTKNFDIFHVVDHSYAQLVHQLPAERTVVSCHDLDTFKCLLNPKNEKRSLPFRLMVRRVLSGLLKANKILCDTNAIRDELLSYGIVLPERVSVVLHGTHPACSRLFDEASDGEAAKILGLKHGQPYLLNVGSTIPRKQIEVLLRIFAEVRKAVPEIQLVRVGGKFTKPQEDLARKLRVKDAVIEAPYLERQILASVYRNASLLLIPSSAEGFGLPVVEAMACGCPVIASDISVLREVGGRAANFCAVNDIGQWSQMIIELLSEKKNDAAAWERRCSIGSAWAARFTWKQSAAQCINIYKQVLERN